MLIINKAITALEMITIYEHVPPPLNQRTNKHSAEIIHDAAVRDAILEATQKTRLSENHEVAFMFIYL